MNRRLNKESRRNEHHRMMAAFHDFLDRQNLRWIAERDSELYDRLLEAFKAGWEAA